MAMNRHLPLQPDPPEGFLRPDACEVKTEGGSKPAVYVDGVRHLLHTRLADNA